MTKMISMEECIAIGANTEEKVFNAIVRKINQKHPSENALTFFDQLSIDLSHEEGLMQDLFPEAFEEIDQLMREEYRALDELEQHCLFIYLFTIEKDENEIVDSMMWHLEEWMENRAWDFLPSPNSDKKRQN